MSLNQPMNTTYSIQCSYISGTDARGCVFILVGGVEGVANITGIINRTSSEGVRIEVPNIGCYREVLAFDLESDNTTGTLPVRENVTLFDICNNNIGTITHLHFPQKPSHNFLIPPPLI